MSYDVISILVYLLFLYYLYFIIDLYFGIRSIKFLDDIYEYTEDLAKISVIIPARNEEKNIEKALRSVLSSNYPSFEVIVVNDRSDDRTPEILKNLQSDYSTLKIVEIDSVPEGWLGKNFALQTGVSCASGNYFLFTDADVIIQKNTLRKAVSYCKSKNLDHLAVAPVIKMPNLLLKFFASAFILYFNIYANPWKAKNPKSKKYIGIGSFNLVRSEVYKKIGGHNTISMRPDDDIKLGKIIKSAGYKQEVLFGKDSTEVEWYSSLSETVNGLLKNSYSGLDYSFFNLVASTIGLFYLFIFPFISVFYTANISFLINLVIIVFYVLIYLIISEPRNNFWYCISLPFMTLLFLFILWRSSLYTIFKKGIVWKGTYYSLNALKSNKI